MMSMLIIAVMTAIVAATAGDGNEKQTLVRNFKSPLKYCSSKTLLAVSQLGQGL